MEYNPTVSRCLSEGETRTIDGEELYKQRKWVGHKVARSLSYEEPGRAMKAVECLTRLRLSNNAVVENNKQKTKMNIRKTFTLPVITQEHSGSENSLETTETNAGDDYETEKKTLVEQEKGRERRWKIMRRVKSEHLLSSQSDRIIQENEESPKQSSISKPKSIDTEMVKSSRSFVALKQSQTSNDLGFRNISEGQLLSENIKCNQEENLVTATDKSLGGDTERFLDGNSLGSYDTKDTKETSDIVNCMRESLNLLVNILDYEQKDAVDSEIKEKQLKAEQITITRMKMEIGLNLKMF